MKLREAWLDVNVLDKPVPQGSMVAFTPKHGGKPIVQPGNKKALTAWRRDVKAAAAKAAPVEPVIGPVWVRLDVVLLRPKGHARDSQPTGRVGDVDKFARAVLDALTGTVYVDDAQVVHLTATKRYSDAGTGVRIRVGSAAGA